MLLSKEIKGKKERKTEVSTHEHSFHQDTKQRSDLPAYKVNFLNQRKKASLPIKNEVQFFSVRD